MSEAERQRRARFAVLVGLAGVIGGLVVGVAAGSGETKTTTETQTVVSTAVKRMPVVRVRTVEHVRRVVRTHTVTVEAAPVVADDGYDDSYDSDTGAGSSYAGMNCSEIGHSFTVTPGSDPEHDADNDGIACESY